MTLDEATARRFATLTLGHLGQRWPFKLDQILTGPDDLIAPDRLHPIFHGSFDWHSCVHGWWQVMRLARLFPAMPEAETIRRRADAMFVPDKVAGELARLDRPFSGGFERPYGWAWLLALHGELTRHGGATWGSTLEPLARAFAARFAAYLPRLTYPIRAGGHANTAFALIHALEWARTHDAALAQAIEARAREWYGGDRACQAWEPGGEDFLSPTLVEAVLMAQVLGPEFAAWFDAFLPDAAAGMPATLFTPAHVSDRADGTIAHLDGVNLSRTWCWRAIAAALGEEHPVATTALAAADAHLAASLPHIADDYMGTHWLASFALLALQPTDA